MDCVIYLLSFDDGSSYIGSSKHLERRLMEHKSIGSNESSKDYNRKIYVKMRSCAYGVSVLENATDIDRYICEQKWIDELKPDLNDRAAYLVGGKKIYDKKRYEENKQKINERKLHKIMCDCGAMVSKNNMCFHKKTNKHLKYITNI